MGSNESVGKVLLTSEDDVFGEYLILRRYKIVDCGAFCEVIFFCISAQNLFGVIFYSLNVTVHREPDLRRLGIEAYGCNGRIKPLAQIFMAVAKSRENVRTPTQEAGPK